jgi:hypothetical protein
MTELITSRDSTPPAPPTFQEAFLSNLWDQLHVGDRGPAAVSTYTHFPGYQDMAISLSHLAQDALIWTIDGSPLRVRDLPRELEECVAESESSKEYAALVKEVGQYLTKADEEFAKHKCRGPKVRIIVFRSYREVKRYIRAGEKAAGRLFFRKASDLDVNRRGAFERACTLNGGSLYFTADFLLRKSLLRHLGNSESGLRKSIDEDQFGVLDIGVIRPTQGGSYCFQSQFESSEFSMSEQGYAEIKFFTLHDKVRGVTAAFHYNLFMNQVLNQSPALKDWAFRTAGRLKQHRGEWRRARARRWMRRQRQRLILAAVYLFRWAIRIGRMVLGMPSHHGN